VPQAPFISSAPSHLKWGKCGGFAKQMAAFSRQGALSFSKCHGTLKMASPRNPQRGAFLFSCAGLRGREPACGSQIRGRGNSVGFAKQMAVFSRQGALSFSNRHAV